MTITRSTPKPKQERIACAAWTHGGSKINDGEDFGYLLVPIEQLPMDFANEFEKDNNHCVIQQGFITTHGRFVTPTQALPIALDAGQCYSPRTAGKLCVTDIFPFWSNVK